MPPSPHSSAASRLAAAAAAETPAAVAASLPLRPPSAGRLAPFTSDPSLPSTLPRKQQSQAQQQTQQQQPQQQAAWGGFSAGATPTAAASASASTSAAALATSTVFGGGIAGGGRSWLKVGAEGRASVVRVDKSHLAAELGVQARDLRLLDPHFNHSYPSAILCRDRVRLFSSSISILRFSFFECFFSSSFPLALLFLSKNTNHPRHHLHQALVVNLEHIKLIITPTQVLVLNSADAAVRAFVEELCRRLEAAPSRPFGTARGAPAAAAAAGDGEAGAPAAGKEGGGKGSRDGVNRPLSALNGGTAAAAAAAPAETAPAAPAAPGGAENDAADASKEPEKPFSETPFELRALEVALETVCAHLEVAAGDLEAAAHPALDYLTAAVTTPNLERVRRVKTRLVRLTTRVETLREVLEKILDDDSDMHDMNLTARALDVIERAQQQQLLQAQQQQQPEPSSPFSAEQQQQQPLLQRSSSQLPAQAAVAPAALVEALEEERERDDTEIAQVEQVLEPYFMQVRGRERKRERERRRRRRKEKREI